MKKVVKILGLLFSIFLIALLTIPVLYKGQIEEALQKEINKHINAQLSFESLNMNLWEHFPNATINISDFLITTEALYKTDTLVAVESIQLTTSLTALFNEPSIDNFTLKNGRISLHSLEDGTSNYNIVATDTTESASVTPSNTTSGISFHIEEYRLENINFRYQDDQSKLQFEVEGFNHRGTGTFSESTVQLNTETTIKAADFWYNNLHYLNNIEFSWLAQVTYDFDTQQVTFNKNNAQLNDLQFYFNGFIQTKSEGIAMDVQFDLLDSEFKSLLSLVPSAYSQNFENIQANGSLDFSGSFKGMYSEKEIPKFDVFISSKDANFKYPELPKTMQHITIDTHIGNKTGALDDTEIQLNKLSFQIDEDIFSASATVRRPISNPAVTAEIKGIINLEKLSETYPVPSDHQLEGLLKVNMKSAFTQKDIDTNNFQAIKNEGNISIHHLTVATDMFPKPLSIETLDIQCTPKYFVLNKCKFKTGKSDLSMAGTVKNLMGFTFGDKDLTGNFDITSKQIITEDFLSESTPNTPLTTDTITTAPLAIPSGIDIRTSLKAQTIYYDNLQLNNFNGILLIKDQAARFQKTSAQLFDGTIEMDGIVNTKAHPATFDVDMSFEKVRISEAFNSIELLSSVAPFAKTIDGTLSTSFDVKGSLDNNLIPETNSISGKALSNVQVSKIDASQSKTMSLLENNIDAIDFSKLDIKKISTKVSFENGVAHFKPFRIGSYDKVPIQMSGSHSFDNDMDYKLTAAVPASFFGKEATKLLSGLSAEEQNDIRVPLQVNIGGSVSKPTITPDYKSALTTLSSKIAASQTNKFVDRLLQTNSKDKDSTKTNTGDEIKKAASKLFKKLF